MKMNHSVISRFRSHGSGACALEPRLCQGWPGKVKNSGFPGLGAKNNLDDTKAP